MCVSRKVGLTSTRATMWQSRHTELIGVARTTLARGKYEKRGNDEVRAVAEMICVRVKARSFGPTFCQNPSAYGCRVDIRFELFSS